MKTLILAAFLLSVTRAKDGCHKTRNDTMFKGRLEVKGMCMNYTIKLLAGNLDTSLIERKWTDETTGKTYSNVFGLGSRCSFPASVEQGEEFLFMIDSSTVQNCAVCLAYYPTPSKHVSIKVIDK
jgi:hypothetical protein